MVSVTHKLIRTILYLREYDVQVGVIGLITSSESFQQRNITILYTYKYDIKLLKLI